MRLLVAKLIGFKKAYLKCFLCFVCLMNISHTTLNSLQNYRENMLKINSILCSAFDILHTCCVHQERSQKGDSGCASEKLGVPHLLSD